MSNTPRTEDRIFFVEEADQITAVVTAEFARQLETELAEARQQLETEQMRLTACSTAALGYFTDCLPEYRSASLEDVLQLRQQLVEQDALVERMREALTSLYSLKHGEFCDDYPKVEVAVKASLKLTPSTALAEHDVEVRRKALEEAADILEFDEFHDPAKGYAETELRRMAKGG